MLEEGDLSAAVAEGIITEAQAAALRRLGQQRARERAIAAGHEERFRLLRGFNDMFFAIGVVLFLLGVAWFKPPGAAGYVLMAAVVWGLAEVLVRRLRLVLPGILLAVAFVALVLAASIGLPAEGWLGSEIDWRLPTAFSILQTLHYYPGGPLVFGVRALVPAGAAAAFYWRFKLPFALLPMAASLVIAAMGLASFLVPRAPAVADTIFFLLCGLGVFAAAMCFDVSDRERLTRRADCAFWLHLLAAPLIVHSVVSLAARPLAGALEPMSTARPLALAVIAIVAVLGLVALLIDRRALLVSGLAYLGAAIGYMLTGDRVSVFAGTLVILGAVVLSLGAGWVPLRRRLLALLSPVVANRLPPAPVRPLTARSKPS
jgi:hypothetical protein